MHLVALAMSGFNRAKVQSCIWDSIQKSCFHRLHEAKRGHRRALTESKVAQSLPLGLEGPW